MNYSVSISMYRLALKQITTALCVVLSTETKVQCCAKWNLLNNTFRDYIESMPVDWLKEVGVVFRPIVLLLSTNSVGFV